MKDKVPNSSDYRSFGMIVGLILACVFGGIIPYIKYKSYNEYFLITGGVLIFLSILLPGSLKYPYILWMKIGDILGYINTRIILTLVFILLFVPIGLIRRILGKDSLGLKLAKQSKSYRKISDSVDIKTINRPF